MNSRPIQHAEKEFFGILWQGESLHPPFHRRIILTYAGWIVPVLAIVTKFDSFVQDVLQELEESADERGVEIDEDALESQAQQDAKDMFDVHYNQALRALPYPPKVVLPLSESQSRPMLF
jgi:hypothetical protein